MTEKYQSLYEIWIKERFPDTPVSEHLSNARRLFFGDTSEEVSGLPTKTKYLNPKSEEFKKCLHSLAILLVTDQLTQTLKEHLAILLCPDTKEILPYRLKFNKNKGPYEMVHRDSHLAFKISELIEAGSTHEEAIAEITEKYQLREDNLRRIWKVKFKQFRDAGIL
jgi:hypothetical protein